MVAGVFYSHRPYQLLILKTNKKMKIKTTAGESLRSEYTALECAAIKYAVSNQLADGYTFVGVPDSSEERYRNCKDVFKVDTTMGGRVVMWRNDKMLEAVYSEGGEKPTPRTPKAEKAEEKQEEKQQTANSELASSGGFSLGMLDNIIASIVDARVNAIKDTLTVQSQEVRHTVEVKRLDGSTVELDGVQNPKFEMVLTLLANGENVYLYGPAGSGKNVMCEQLAKALGVPFYYQNTIMTKFDVVGYKNATGDFEETEFYKAWTGGGLFMLDEIDNAQAEALVTLNAALANGYYSFPGVGMVKKHPDFRCIAAGNTNGEGATEQYCGRYQMDESSRDRFVFVEIDYCKEIEEAICKGHEDVLEFVYDLRAACKDSQVNLILGYRCLSRLCKYADTFTAEELINTMILKGKDIDSVRLLVSRFYPTNYNNKFSSTFKNLVK